MGRWRALNVKLARVRRVRKLFWPFYIEESDSSFTRAIASRSHQKLLKYVELYIIPCSLSHKDRFVIECPPLNSNQAPSSSSRTKTSNERSPSTKRRPWHLQCPYSIKFIVSYLYLISFQKNNSRGGSSRLSELRGADSKDGGRIVPFQDRLDSAI